MAKFEFLIFAKPLLIETGNVERLLEVLSDEPTIRIVAIEQRQVTRDLIEQHYAASSTKPFFPGLVKYYEGKTILCIKCTTYSVEDLECLRCWIGSASIEKNSLRDFLVSDMYAEWTAKNGPYDNGVHCSDSFENGSRELSLWGL
jgi:nucleoside diphosphate kinase